MDTKKKKLIVTIVIASLVLLPIVGALRRAYAIKYQDAVNSFDGQPVTASYWNLVWSLIKIRYR